MVNINSEQEKLYIQLTQKDIDENTANALIGLYYGKSDISKYDDMEKENALKSALNIVLDILKSEKENKIYLADNGNRDYIYSEDTLEDENRTERISRFVLEKILCRTQRIIPQSMREMFDIKD